MIYRITHTTNFTTKKEKHMKYNKWWIVKITMKNVVVKNIV